MSGSGGDGVEQRRRSPRSPDPKRLVLGLIVMFLGGSGLVYEYCLSTLATHLIGNSIEQFSLIIALMLFAMGLAGVAQRSLGHGTPIAEVFVYVEIGLAVIGGSSAVALYLAFAWLEHFRFVLYGLALVIGFGIGLEIPLLLRLNQQWRSALKDNVGDILSLDYVGALVGALVWAFLMLPWLPLDRISLILGLANLGAALVTFLLLRELIVRRAVVVAALAGAALLLSLLYSLGPGLVADARQRLYADPVRFHRTSPYQDIVVTGRGARLTLYLNGHLQFDSEDEHIYHEMLVHPALLALGRPPVSVLVLGGGDGLAVREVLRWPSVKEVVLVDLDPAVTSLARTFEPLVRLNEGALLDDRVSVRAAPGVTPGPELVAEKLDERPRLAAVSRREEIARVSVLHLDADAFLRATDGRWDVIVADFPDPSTPDLAKLYSLEFYQQLVRRLAPGGVVVTQSGSPYASRGAFWCVRDTLEAAGLSVASLHAHVPSFGEWGWHVGRLHGPVRPAGRTPFPVRYVHPDVIDASRVFPRLLERPAGPAQVSTRLDPRVMRLYRRGEPLEGGRLFPGRAVR